MKSLFAFLVMVTLAVGTVILFILAMGIVVTAFKTNSLKMFMGGLGTGWVAACSLMGAVSFYDDIT